MQTALRRSLRTTATLLLVAFSYNQIAFAGQLQPQTPPSATTSTTVIAAQIATAHTVFLTNSGADSNFPIDSTQAYDQVHAALQSWGRYQLVNSPAQADLVFQLRDIAPITSVTGFHGDVASITSPAFQLAILDPQTKIDLWTITSPVRLKGKGDTLAHWQTVAVTNLVSRIKVVAGQPLSSTETASLTTYPNYHRTRNTAILIGGAAAIGLAAALLVHHEYENNLANQKATQDAFCKANNIPLSECAGG